MIATLLFEYLFIPFGQSLLYDIVKQIFDQGNNQSRLQKTLRSIIRKSTNKVLKGKNEELINAIVSDIYDECSMTKEVDIYNITRKEFEDWGEENLDPKQVAAAIYNNIAAEIAVDTDLARVLTAQKQLELVQKYDNLKKQLCSIDAGIKTLVDLSTSNTELLQSIVAKNLEVSESIKKMDEKAKYISEAYKSFFWRPLFLENKSADGKTATLRDVYIQNKFHILDFQQQNKGVLYTDIANFIEQYVQNNLLTHNFGTTYSFDSKHVNVLFVKGHPGSGKSSLFYYLAYLKSSKPSFLPNHDLYFAKYIEIFDAVNGKISVDNPFDDFQKVLGINLRETKNTVLILDGLDEVCVARNFNIYDYCWNLIRSTSSYKNLKIIITTRLNYINITNANNKNVFNIELRPLDIEDLELWIEKYFLIHTSLKDELKVSHQNIKFIKDTSASHFLDILAIPLLFYMIVASKIDISKIGSIGELYDCVFEELRDRSYNESDFDFQQKHGINRIIPHDLARQIAIEISKVMYDSNTLLLKLNSGNVENAISKACSTSYAISSQDKKQIEKLFPITFFYKNSSIDVVEFAHKSIMEFFAAEKLYQEFVASDGNFDEYLKNNLLDPVISTEVLSFLHYFFSSRDSSAVSKKYANILDQLKQSIDNKTAYPIKGITYSFETSKVVFKLYWYFVRTIFKIPCNITNIFLRENLIRRHILGNLSISDSKSVPILNNRNLIYDFSSLSFEGYHFAYCNLEYACFRNASFQACNFSYSNLNNIILEGSAFESFTKFLSCSMDNAKISDLRLSSTILGRNNTLGNSEKITVEFESVSFSSASFSNLDLRKFNFLSINSMTNTQFDNVKMYLHQLKQICIYDVIFNDVEVYVLDSDLTKEELSQYRELKKNDRLRAEKIVIDSVVGRLQKAKRRSLIISEIDIKVTID